MAGRLEGRVAVVSGAARGQGREHAVALARAGCDIVAFDIAAPLTSPQHTSATLDDLLHTTRLVEDEGRRVICSQADARDLAQLRALADRAMAEFGRIDVLVVNHGIWAVSKTSWETEEADWQESIDVLLTGAWKVTTAFIPKMIESGRGGAVILTSSMMGIKPQPSSVAYTAAKHGVMGLMRTLAWEAGPTGIRVNAVLPATVDTEMTRGPHIQTASEWNPRFMTLNRSLLPGGDLVHPSVISNAVVFLASDEAEYITGVGLPVDAGWSTF